MHWSECGGYQRDAYRVTSDPLIQRNGAVTSSSKFHTVDSD